MLEIKEVGKPKVRLLIPSSFGKQVHSLIGGQNKRSTHCDCQSQNGFHRHSNVVPA